MIGVTHAGTYCLLCKTNFPSHLWRRHFNRNHPDISLPKKINNIANILNQKISTVLCTENPSCYRADNKIYKHIQCSSCNGIFRDRHQHQKHITSIHNLCGEFTPASTVNCYRLLCGRLFPIHPPSIVNNNPPPQIQQNHQVTIHNHDVNQENNSISHIVLSPPSIIRQHHQNNSPGNMPLLPLPTLQHPQSVTRSSGTSAQYYVSTNPLSTPANESLKFMQYFDSLPFNNTVHQKDVEATLNELIDRADTTEYWIKILHKFIATDDNFIETLKYQLELQNLKPEIVLSCDHSMSKLMDLFIDLEGHLKSITDGIPANWKAALVKFEVSREFNSEIEGATTWTFRYRQNSSPQLREFGYLLCYLKHLNCSIFEKYYQCVSSQDFSHHHAVRSGIVAKFIYELTVENVTNGDYIPWICKFALFRCFKLDNHSPKLKKHYICGKQFATILYLMRECVLTCSSMMLNGGHSDHALSMIRLVQNCHVINMIAPWISYCRAMAARSIQKETSYLAANGDIICNYATFRKCIYTQLIPLVRSSICEIFHILFEGDDWRAFLSNQNIIRVRRLL